MVSYTEISDYRGGDDTRNIEDKLSSSTFQASFASFANDPNNTTAKEGDKSVAPISVAPAPSNTVLPADLNMSTQGTRAAHSDFKEVCCSFIIRA